ncbi:hypothetical protein BX070DRAFT_219063 [Coemansia spiralis]|nr:hypothetical protein BX070DRAFT_219063 [Coemansia spiralis]
MCNRFDIFGLSFFAFTFVGFVFLTERYWFYFSVSLAPQLPLSIACSSILHFIFHFHRMA